MSIRTALVGVGGYGYRYVDNLCRLADEKRLEICAAVARDPERCAQAVEQLRARGAVIVKSTEELYQLSGSYDLVCLPVGIGNHAPLTVEALRHDCNVLVEKPLAGSLDDARRMIAARDAAPGRFVAVGFQHLYEPETRKIKRLLVSGRLGAVRRMVLMGRWPRGDAYYSRNNWVGRVSGGSAQLLDSPFNNAFAHYLNLALYLAGPSMDVAAEPVLTGAELTRARDIEMFDSGVVRFRAGGAEGLAMFTHCCAEVCEPRIRLECENGSVTFEERGRWLVLDRAGKTLPESGGPCEATHRPMFEAVVRRVSDPGTPICTPEIAVNQLKLVEAMHRSAEIRTLPPGAYHRREEDGVYIVEGLPESWDRLYAE